jgi:heparanase 1
LQKGITLLLINLDSSTTVDVNVKFNSTLGLHRKHKTNRSHETKVIRLLEGSTSEITREEYHLTAKDGDLHSRIMLLNGNILTVNSSGDIPSFEPLLVNSSKPIMVAPFSIVFVQMSYVLPACS